MSRTKSADTKINQWIEEVFKSYHFTDINVELNGSTEEGDGATTESTIKQFDVVIKYGKTLQGMLNTAAKDHYQRESCFYTEIVPEFRTLGSKYNVTFFEEFQPKSFGCVSNSTDEAIILQDLKVLGYELHDRFTPFNRAHLEATFTHYGKYHAFSMALREKCPETFNSLIGRLDNLFITHSEIMYRKFVEVAQKNIYGILSEKIPELIEKLQKLCPEGFLSAMLEVALKENSSHSVLIHGDCWNNNFMFIYDEFDKSTPKEVAFLDFQGVHLTSPVLDLAYHFYVTAGVEELPHLEELLELYHNSLSNVLKQFQCDPEIVYPYKELLRQWKGFSLYGFILGIGLIPITVAAADEILSLEDLAYGDRSSLDLFSETKRSLITERIAKAVKQFIEFQERIEIV